MARRAKPSLWNSLSDSFGFIRLISLEPTSARTYVSPDRSTHPRIGLYRCRLRIRVSRFSSLRSGRPAMNFPAESSPGFLSMSFE
jgi:hypothetical protein